MKRDREQEIYNRVSSKRQQYRRRQQQQQEEEREVQNNNNFGPMSSLRQHQHVQQHYNMDANINNFLPNVNYGYHLQRQYETENIILAKNARLRLQNDILENANLEVQNHARESEAKKRALSNLLYNSHLSNTWNRFDLTVNEQLNTNQYLMETLDEDSLQQRNTINNNIPGHVNKYQQPYQEYHPYSYTI